MAGRPNSIIQHESLIIGLQNKYDNIKDIHRAMVRDHNINIEYEALRMYIYRRNKNLKSNKEIKTYSESTAVIIDNINKQKKELEIIGLSSDSYLENLGQLISLCFIGASAVAPGADKHNSFEFKTLTKLYSELLTTYHNLSIGATGFSPQQLFNFNIEVTNNVIENKQTETINVKSERLPEDKQSPG